MATFGLTGADFGRLKTQAEGALRFKEKYKARFETVVEKFVESSITGATGLTLGFLDGYFYQSGGVGFGLPASAWAAVFAHGSALMLGGKAAPHLHSVGNASLAYWSGSVGHRVGQNFRDKKPLLSDTKIAGELPTESQAGQRLSPDDLRAVAEGRAS